LDQLDVKSERGKVSDTDAVSRGKKKHGNKEDEGMMGAEVDEMGGEK